MFQFCILLSLLYRKFEPLFELYLLMKITRYESYQSATKRTVWFPSCCFRFQDDKKRLKLKWHEPQTAWCCMCCSHFKYCVKHKLIIIHRCFFERDLRHVLWSFMKRHFLYRRHLAHLIWFLKTGLCTLLLQHLHNIRGCREIVIMFDHLHSWCTGNASYAGWHI